MYKFDSEAFIKEMESLDGVEETPLDFEEFESWYENELQTERDLKKWFIRGIIKCLKLEQLI